MSRPNVLKALAAGFAGACAVTLIHEIVRRRVPRAPRLDILGMRSVAKVMRFAGSEPPEHLRTTALASDLVANTAYYSLVGAAGAQHSLLAGSVLGAAAGLGAVMLPKPMGLGVGPTDRTAATQAMAASLYLAGGVLAGTAYKRLQ